MPRVCVIPAGAAQRRQISEEIAFYEKNGHTLTLKSEGGSVSGVDWATLFAGARSGGLFDEKQLMLIDSAETLGPFPAELEDYLEDDGADAVIICAFGAEMKKVFSPDAVKKIKLIAKDENIPPWKRREWLMRLAALQRITLAGDAAALLAESIEEQEELRGELEKLSCCGDAITVDMVKRLSFDEGGRALLRFLDGFSQGKADEVLASLAHLKRDPSPLPLLTALINRLRPAAYMVLFQQERERAMKLIGARDYAVRMASQALNIYGGVNLKYFMAELIRLSITEKTSAAEGWPGFETATLRMLARAKCSKTK